MNDCRCHPHVFTKEELEKAKTEADYDERIFKENCFNCFFFDLGTQQMAEQEQGWCYLNPESVVTFFDFWCICHER